MLKDKSLIFVQNCPIWLSFGDPVCRRLKVPVRPPSAVWSRETPEGPPRDWEEHLKGLSALIECLWWASSPVPSLCWTKAASGWEDMNIAKSGQDDQF